jgi:methionyl-tRNA formyltransferase
MKTLCLLTGSELRHTFFRLSMAAAETFAVWRSYCEGQEQSLEARLETAAGEIPSEVAAQRAHAAARAQSERDFFELPVRLLQDRSRPRFIAKGAINQAEIVGEILAAPADLICAYGCSLIKTELVGRFAGRFLNLHLGLSPYYRGSGTNYFPLVNEEPEYVGATFMFLDQGIDTGKIIHQIRARVYPGDTVHSIGNRLIGDAAFVYARIVEHFDELVDLPQQASPHAGRLYLRKHFTPDSLSRLQRNFREGMVERYLARQAERDHAVPLIQQPFLTAEGN